MDAACSFAGGEGGGAGGGVSFALAFASSTRRPRCVCARVVRVCSCLWCLCVRARARSRMSVSVFVSEFVSVSVSVSVPVIWPREPHLRTHLHNVLVYVLPKNKSNHRSPPPCFNTSLPPRPPAASAGFKLCHYCTSSTLVRRLSILRKSFGGLNLCR